MHEDVAGVAVIGLGDLEHEVHLGPGLDVEILLICLGVVIQDRLPGFGKPLFDALRVDTVRLRVIADVIDNQVVVLSGHGVHLREFEEFLALIIRQLVVVFEHKPVVITVGVFLRGQQVAAEVSAVHPEVDELRFEADAHIVREVLRDLVTHEGVVVVVREQRPLFLLHAVDEFGLVFRGVSLVIIDREVIRLLRHDPGGASAAVDLDVFFLVVPHLDLTERIGLMVEVQLHVQNRALALIQLKERSIYFGRALHGLDGQGRGQSPVGDEVGDFLSGRGDRRLAALKCLSVFRERDIFPDPREAEF